MQTCHEFVPQFWAIQIPPADSNPPQPVIRCGKAASMVGKDEWSAANSEAKFGQAWAGAMFHRIASWIESDQVW